MTAAQPNFDPTQLHPGAAAAFDRDGAALLEARQLESIKTEKPPDFKSRRIPKATITDADMVGEPLMAWSDISGRITGRYFVKDGNRVTLRDQGYRALRRLVEKVLRSKPFTGRLSEDFIEIEIFKWWQATLRNETSDPLSARLLAAAYTAVGWHTLMVPIANFEIERPFQLGNVLVTPFDPELIDKFEVDSVIKFPERETDIRQNAQDMREEFAHLTMIQVDIFGELGFAQNQARTMAFDMADVIRFMSPPAVSWNIKYACFPLGYEHEPQSTIIQLRDDKLGVISSGLLGAPSFRWRLSFEQLDECMVKLGFRNCAAFFEDRPLSGFQKRVKTAISAYAQSVAAMDIRNRLIYAMSAAEHLLLRDENEGIQSAVGERMAFLIVKDAKKRQDVVANFRKVYGLRSRHIHHLRSIADEDSLAIFFRNMWGMLLVAMQNMSRYKEHSQFLDAIDRLKFS